MNTKWWKRVTLSLVLGLAALGALAVGLASPLPADAPAEGSAAGAAGGSPPWPCLPFVQPRLTSQVPGDTAVNDQASLNCFAWQELIALNWPAAPEGGGNPDPVGPEGFGRPGDLRPVVWETFMSLEQVMTPDGSQPAKWGTRPEVPAACRKHGGGRLFVRTSKISIDFDAAGDVDEAFPESGPDWLADRDGNPVLYEIVMDQAEYSYIVQNGFYNARTQYEKVSAGTHVNLPRGVTGGAPGAIELKAAWLLLPEGPVGEKWTKRYKLSEAYVYNEKEDDCRKATVALVGLHILHKTTSNPQWIWATFEHVDNAPDQSAVDRKQVEDRYTFYRPDCPPQQVPRECRTLSIGDCQAPASPAETTSCVPNTAPAYCLDLFNPKCRPYPIQVTRVTPIPNSGDNLVRDLNAAAQNMIRRQAGKDSVWQHYQLVGVLWSGSPVDENLPGTPPPVVPLAISGIRPDPEPLASGNSRPLANTTLETYIQTTVCTSCHSGATLAWPGQDAKLKQLASDYSFVFQSAHPRLPAQGSPGQAGGAAREK